MTKPKYTKLADKNRYSWMKAPRYHNKPTETGPLATVLIAYAKGQPECKGLVDTVLKHLDVGPEALFSTLGRTAARGIECAVIAAKTETWLNQIGSQCQKRRYQAIRGMEDAQGGRGRRVCNRPPGSAQPLDYPLRTGKLKTFNWWFLPPGTWDPVAPWDDWDRWKRP